jgi:hypothetical protein
MTTAVAMFTGLRLLLWVTFAVGLGRAWHRHRLADPAARTIWALFALWVITLTLIENAMTTPSLTPVALQSAGLILTLYGYYHLLKPLGPEGSDYRVLDYLGPLSLVLLLTVLLVASFQGLSAGQQSYIVVVVRDCTLLVYTLAVFIPGTRRLWREETAPLLKFKQGGALVCFHAYLVISVCGLLLGAITIDGVLLAPLFGLKLLVALIALTLALMPYRWLVVFFQLQRLLTYARLRRLERRFALAADRPLAARPAAVELLNTDVLELAIYQTVIAIFDHHPLAAHDPWSMGLVGQLEVIIAAGAPYPVLVKQLAAVRL